MTSCFLIKVFTPKLVYIGVGSVVSFNLCAKNRKKERSLIRKGEIYANFAQTFLIDSEIQFKENNSRVFFALFQFKIPVLL